MSGSAFPSLMGEGSEEDSSGTEDEESRRRATITGGLFCTSTGTLAVLDQGLFAGTNFLTNILLARWLTEPEYGAFALAFSLLLLAGAFHSAVLTEPMMVFGPGKFAKRFRRYLAVLVWGHFGLMVPVSLLLVGGATILGHIRDGGMNRHALGLAVAIPLVLLLWMVRRAFYVQSKPGWAAAGGTFYLVFQLLLLYLLKLEHQLTASSALMAMGASSLVTALGLLTILRPAVWNFGGVSEAVSVSSTHWGYGAWSTGTLPLAWFSSNLYYSILPIWSGLAAGGALKALLNLAMPALHVMSALSLVLLPAFVRKVDSEGVSEMMRIARTALYLFLAGAAVFLLVLIGFGSRLLKFLYGGKYESSGGMDLFLVALIPFGAAAISVGGAALRAMRRPDLVFYGYTGAFLIAVAVGIPLTWSMQVHGALIGLVASSVATGLIMLLLLRTHQSGR